MKFEKEDLKSKRKSIQPKVVDWWVLLGTPYITVDDLILNLGISREDGTEILTESKANKFIKTSTEVYTISDVPKFFNTIQKYIDR